MTPLQVRKQLTPVVSTLLLFVVWQTACWMFRIPTFILPTPIESMAALVENWSGIWPNALHTLITTLIGFGAAVIVGIVLGIAVGTSALVYDAVNPFRIGYLMLSASATFRIPLVFAGLLVIALMGVIMYMAAARLERRFASWATRGSEIGGGYMGGG